MPPKRKSETPPSGEVSPRKGRASKTASGNETREALLSAARKVLLEDGLSAVTTRRVANAANVNQALVHYHFGSIENLLLVVLDTVVADVRRAERIFYGPGDLLAKWRTFISDFLSHDVPDGTTKIWVETVVMVAAKPETRQRYVETIATSTHERLMEVVRSGVPEDTPEDEIEGLASLMMAVRKSISLDSLVDWTRGQEALLRLVDRIIADRVALNSKKDSEPTDVWPPTRARR